MKPCDVRTTQDAEALSEQGLQFNNKSIRIDGSGVILEIRPYAWLKIDHRNFKRFAEWYLGRDGDYERGYFNGYHSG
jgi:hypothetical protein